MLTSDSPKNNLKFLMTLMTLTKAELAEIIFEKVGLNKTEAKEMVEAFFEEIRSSLAVSYTHLRAHET